MKATQGLRYIDKNFPDFWGPLGSLSDEQQVLRGAYHFLSADGNAAAQAENFLRWVNRNGGMMCSDLPAAMDLEWDLPSSAKGDAKQDRWYEFDRAWREGGKKGDHPIIKETLTWLKIVKQSTGKNPVLYTSKAFWEEHSISENEIRKLQPLCTIWIANYSPTAQANEVPDQIGNVRETLWQFTESANIGSNRKKLDANVFKGTEQELYDALQINL